LPGWWAVAEPAHEVGVHPAAGGHHVDLADVAMAGLVGMGDQLAEPDGSGSR
jgi:hypothetical protein